MNILFLISFFWATFYSFGGSAQTPFSKPFGLGGASMTTPVCSDGSITAMAPYLNRLMIIGGTFTQVGPCSGSGVPLDLATGNKNSSFDWSSMGISGTVSAVIPDGNGGWYIGGAFTSVGNNSISYVAKISSTGWRWFHHC
jgi:hypothetical protein